ncbi:MAG: AAA family ATPase [Gammaproteobacteria bacterium]
MDDQDNDFFARLGLDKDPFPAEVDSSFYHENPDLLQRLDMIQHLIGFSNQMIFITGQRGIGKTSMLQRLEYYAPENWRICRIQANPMLNTPTLLRQLTSGFELEVAADADDMFQVYAEALQAHVQTLERAMLIPVVLIDDAHELPVDAFTMLFGFMQQEVGHSSMKMALFCEPQITTMLESPQLKSLSQNLTHQLEIPAFDERQTRDYLEQRLLHAGLTEDFPFLSEVVHKIHRESDGIAGKIHLLAQQALLDESAQNEPKPLPVVDQVMDFGEEVDEAFPAMSTSERVIEKAAPIGRKFQSWQIGAVAFVLALLAAVLWLTSQFSDTTDSMIAEELPLDLTPEPEDPGIEEPEALDPSLFVEPSASEELIPSEQETNPVVGQANSLEETIPQEVLTQTEIINKIEAIVSPDTHVDETQIDPAPKAEVDQVSEPDLKEAISEPHREFVEALEAPDQIIEQEQLNETVHQQSEVTVQIDENGNPQIVEIETPVVEAPKIVENQAGEAIAHLPDVTEKILPVNQAEPARQQPASSTIIVDQQAELSGDSITGINDGEWLRAQDDSLIVLQLLGTHDQLAMRKIIDQNQLGSDVAWFTTMLNGEPWYVVVKGPFNDRSSAIASAASLSAEIRRRKPWPRTIASVKKAMDLIQ